MRMIESATLGRRIKDIMERKNVKPKHLAQKLDVGESRVSQLINDKAKNVGIETIREIAAALDVSVGELLGERGNAAPAPLPSWVIIAGRRVEQSSPVYETASILLELPAAQQEMVLNMVKGLRTQKNSNPGIASENVA